MEKVKGLSGLAALLLATNTSFAPVVDTVSTANVNDTRPIYSEPALPLTRTIPNKVPYNTTNQIFYFDGQRTNVLNVSYHERYQGKQKVCAAEIEVNGIKIYAAEKGVKTRFLGENGFTNHNSLYEVFVADSTNIARIKYPRNPEPTDKAAYEKIEDLYWFTRGQLNDIKVQEQERIAKENEEKEKASKRPIEELLRKIPFDKRVEDESLPTNNPAAKQ